MNVPIERKRKVGASKKNLSCYQKQPSDCAVSEEIMIDDDEDESNDEPEQPRPSKKAKTSNETVDANVNCKKCNAPLK